MFDNFTVTVHCRGVFLNFIAVSSKLFFSQSVMSTFCASNSPLHPTRGGRGKQGNE